MTYTLPDIPDAYLLTRPWNQHVEGAQRVLDLLHFAEVIR